MEALNGFVEATEFLHGGSPAIIVVLLFAWVAIKYLREQLVKAEEKIEKLQQMNAERLVDADRRIERLTERLAQQGTVGHDNL
jgi:hypothetical protein